MIYLTADPHFWHTNIIRYANRPFSSVEEMNDSLIGNWNSVVNEDDDVYILGDFVFGFRPAYLEYVLYHTLGNKYLILGNHDYPLYRKGAYKKVGGIIIYKEPIEIDGYVLSHRPLEEAKVFDFINIHGHIHEQIKNDPHYINVCVEHTNYTPILFSEAVSGVQKSLH